MQDLLNYVIPSLVGLVWNSPNDSVKKNTLKSVSIISFSLWSDNKWLVEVQN